MSFKERPDFGDCLEILLSRIYHRILRRGDVVVDGGANGGLHALPLAKRIGPTGRLYAYEPHPQPFRDLTGALTNTRLVDRCALRQVAIGRAPGRAPFFVHKREATLSSMRRMNDADDWIEIEIQIVRLDDEDIPHSVRFIKLDLEGGEHDALRGGAALIGRDRPVISFENGFEWPAVRFGYDLASFYSFFADLHYEVYDFLGVRATPETFSYKHLTWQLVAIPAESELRAPILDEIFLFNSRHAEIPKASNWGEVMQRVSAPLSLFV